VFRVGDARTGVPECRSGCGTAVAQVVEPDADLDLAALGVLDRVRQQVAEHLAQPQRIAHHHARHGWLDAADHLQLLSLGLARVQLARLLGEFAHVERLEHQVHLAGLDLRVVEDVVDDLHHRLGGGAHRVHEAPLPLVELGAREQFAMPSTPFIGVRISWLMFARKSSLERVSASARRSLDSSSRCAR